MVTFSAVTVPKWLEQQALELRNDPVVVVGVAADSWVGELDDDEEEEEEKEEEEEEVEEELDEEMMELRKSYEGRLMTLHLCTGTGCIIFHLLEPGERRDVPWEAVGEFLGDPRVRVVVAGGRDVAASLEKDHGLVIRNYEEAEAKDDQEQEREQDDDGKKSNKTVWFRKTKEGYGSCVLTREKAMEATLAAYAAHHHGIKSSLPIIIIKSKM